MLRAQQGHAGQKGGKAVGGDPSEASGPGVGGLGGHGKGVGLM